jgi:hypothetical protein
MLKKIFDLFSIVRFYEFMFGLVKKISLPFESVIMPFLNWRLRPERSVRPKRGSTLQLKLEPDELAYVGWPVIRYLFRPFIRANGEEVSSPVTEESENSISLARVIIAIPLMALSFLAIILVIASSDPFMEDLIFPRGLPEPNTGLQIGGQGIPLQLIILLVFLVILLFLIWFFGLIFTYWRYEWERRHQVFAFFLEGLLHLEAEFVGRAVTPFYSGDNKKVDTLTPADEMMEIEVVTDVEDLPGGERTSQAQDKWTQYLSKKYQTQSIRIASRSGSPDILRSIRYAPTTLTCIEQIKDLGRTYKETLRSFEMKQQDVLVSGASTSGYDVKAGTGEAGRIWENFDRLYPQPVKVYPDGFALQDPGIWNRLHGELVREVKIENPTAIPAQIVEEEFEDNPKIDQEVPQERSTELFPPLTRGKRSRGSPTISVKKPTPAEEDTKIVSQTFSKEEDDLDNNESEAGFWESIS